MCSAKRKKPPWRAITYEIRGPVKKPACSDPKADTIRILGQPENAGINQHVVGDEREPYKKGELL